MRRYAFALALGLLLGAGFLVFGRASPARPRSVLIITLDTLRADAAGRHHGTPAIADFLAGATHYRNVRTVAPLTLPAHVSLFTGCFPPRSGIHDNVTQPLPPRSGRDFTLLAEEFREAGYATAAFVARPVLAARTGISAGFDWYDCPPVTGEFDESYVPAEERVGAALDWLKTKPGPTFTWVHLFDPHAPYRPYPGDARRPGTTARDSDAVRYAGEVRRADAAVERLLRAVGDDTIVVLVSDHGESLGEHDEVGHGPLGYSTTLDIFLALRGPGVRAGAEDTGLRSICDVAPTLRQMCGLRASPGPEGEAGRSLLGPPHAVLVSEPLFTYRFHGWGQVFAAADGRHTLVEMGPRLELFDRRPDPAEKTPLPLADAAFEPLDRALLAYRHTGNGGSGDGPLLGSVSPYGSLGRRAWRYLARDENGRLLDPRTHLQTWGAMEEAYRTALMGNGRREAAVVLDGIRRLRSLNDVTPGSPRLHYCLASALAMAGELTADARYFADAAREELRAIACGFAEDEPQMLAVRFAIRSGRAETLGEVLRALATLPAVPPPVADALDDGIRALGLELEGELAEAHARVQRSAAAPQARS